jgi:hypothetical protein
MDLALGVLYTAFLFVSSIFTIYLWKKEKISAYSIFNASFILYYILTPLILILFNSIIVDYSGRFISFIYSSTIKRQYIAFFISVVSYSVIVITYFLSKDIRYNKKTKKINISVDVEISMRIVYRYGIVLFFIGAISILMFFYELGGFAAALRFSNSLRGLGSKPEDYYGATGALFRMLSFLILGSSYCLKIYSDYKKSMAIRIILWISYVLSAMYLLFNAGRAPILLFLVPFILEFIYKRNKNVLITLIVILIGTIFIANIFDLFLLTLSSGNIKVYHASTTLFDSIIDVIQDLSFPYSNILIVDSMIETFGYRFGQDYFIWAFDVLPTRILSVIGISIPNFESINAITSAFYYMLSPSRGGVPSDLITLGMMQLHIAGVVLNTFIFSIFALYVDKLARRVGKEYFLIIARIDLLFLTLIPNNDITAIVRGSLFIIVLIFLLRSISNKSRAISKNLRNVEIGGG